MRCASISVSTRCQRRPDPYLSQRGNRHGFSGHRRPLVGAGLFAKAVGQLHMYCLARRLREQARSHRSFIVLQFCKSALDLRVVGCQTLATKRVVAAERRLVDRWKSESPARPRAPCEQTPSSAGIGGPDWMKPVRITFTTGRLNPIAGNQRRESSYGARPRRTSRRILAGL